MGYFESIKQNYRHNYLTSAPRKSEVLDNAQIEGLTAILPDSNNRAVTIETGNAIYLQSYDTIVCRINKTLDSGKFFRMWGGYSVTTMKHINTFRESHGLTKLSKKEWESLTV